MRNTFIRKYLAELFLRLIVNSHLSNNQVGKNKQGGSAKTVKSLKKIHKEVWNNLPNFGMIFFKPVILLQTRYLKDKTPVLYEKSNLHPINYLNAIVAPTMQTM